jgi:hypothetical protein
MVEQSASIGTPQANTNNTKKSKKQNKKETSKKQKKKSINYNQSSITKTKKTV